MDLPDILKDYGNTAGVVVVCWLFLKFSSPFTSRVIDALEDLRVIMIEVRDGLKKFNGNP